MIKTTKLKKQFMVHGIAVQVLEVTSGKKRAFELNVDCDEPSIIESIYRYLVEEGIDDAIGIGDIQWQNHLNISLRQTKLESVANI